MRKIFIGACFGALVFFSARLVVLADGGMIPPTDRYVYETDQKAVVFYENGAEKLIISTSFQGDAGDFAWIIPTPSKPETSKSTDMLFTRLDEITKPDYPMPELPRGWGGVDMLNQAEKSGVTVLETKLIDNYEVSVLEATDDDSLYNWLNDHGYRFPQQGKDIVDGYIQKGWFFTAVKVNDERNSNLVQRQLASGHATPLMLSFPTDQIVYPLKISTLNGMKDEAPKGEISYIDGVVGKAVLVNSDRMIASDRVVPGFNISSGKIRFHLKKRNSDPLNNIIKIEKASSTGSVSKIGLKVANQLEDRFTFEVYSENFNQQFLVGLANDFKENQWQSYEFDWNLNTATNSIDAKFFLDGIERTLNRAGSYSNGIIADGIPSEKAVVSIGGEFYASGPIPVPEKVETQGIRPDTSNYFINHNGDILIDELAIESQDQPVLKANFADDLSFTVRDGSSNVFRIYSNPDQYYWDYPGATSMGVLLYVFSDKKVEVPGFETQYAGWMKKDEVSSLAYLDGSKSWVEPQGDKYYLTRLYRYMDTAEMTEDLYPKPSKDQDPFNAPGSQGGKMIWLYIFLVLSVGSVTVMIFVMVRKTKATSLTNNN